MKTVAVVIAALLVATLGIALQVGVLRAQLRAAHAVETIGAAVPLDTSVPSRLHGVEPYVGPAFVDSFTVSCGSSATLIQSVVGTQIAYSCQLPLASETGGTVLVAVGDSLIADPALATRNSNVYSGDTIREFGGDVKAEYCRADTGSVTIFCRAMIAASSAP